MIPKTSHVSGPLSIDPIGRFHPLPQPLMLAHEGNPQDKSMVRWLGGLCAALLLMLLMLLPSATGQADDAAAEQATADYSTWLAGVAEGERMARQDLAPEIAAAYRRGLREGAALERGLAATRGLAAARSAP